MPDRVKQNKNVFLHHIRYLDGWKVWVGGWLGGTNILDFASQKQAWVRLSLERVHRQQSK